MVLKKKVTISILHVNNNDYQQNSIFTLSVISSRDSFERFSIQNLYSKHESFTVLIGIIYPTQLLLVKSGYIIKILLFEFQYNETNRILLSSFSILKIYNYSILYLCTKLIYIDHNI